MPKGSETLTSTREEEILKACALLYETRSFKDITIKEIGAATSFTRTSIYNYFQTKEEIFLALLQKEYELWVADLDGLRREHTSLTDDALVEALAHSLARRELLLKLMSTNLYDMEANSRMERLVAFKMAYGASLQAVSRLLEKFRPQMTATERQEFVYAFFPFIYGIYPYTAVSKKQRQAMEEAGVAFVYQSIDDLAQSCLKKLLLADRPK